MPVTLSIKNAPDDVVERLRERAVRNRRSLQGELLTIIEAAADPYAQARDAARDTGKLTVEELLADVRRLRIIVPGDSGELLRADRDRDENR